MSQKSAQELQEMIEELQKRVGDGLAGLAKRVAELERLTTRLRQEDAAAKNRSGVRPG
jgi:hypothetical protein